MTMTDIFAPAQIAGITFNNRMLRAAADETEGTSDGFPTDFLTRRYVTLAKGGVGGIITGYIGVSPEGRSQQPGMVLLDRDEKIEPLKKMTDAVHEAGAPIIAQIAHCGANGAGGKAFNVNGLKEEDFYKIIDDFVNAAVRARKSGFDGVEIHTAHGYFLSQMLSAHTNHRHDMWGGSEENRFRIIREIMTRIRKGLPDYPVFAKINGEEGFKDGVHAEEAARIAKRLEDCGISAIEVSRGIDATKSMGPMYGRIPADMILSWYPGIKDLPAFAKKMARPFLPKVMQNIEPAPRCYNVPAAKAVKAAVHVPVIAVGGIHDLAEIKKTINEDGLDFVSIARPLILEPGLIKKYREGKQDKAKCIECNHCAIGIFNGTLRCFYGKVPDEIKPTVKE